MCRHLSKEFMLKTQQMSIHPKHPNKVIKFNYEQQKKSALSGASSKYFC